MAKQNISILVGVLLIGLVLGACTVRNEDKAMDSQKESVAATDELTAKSPESTSESKNEKQMTDETDPTAGQEESVPNSKNETQPESTGSTTVSPIEPDEDWEGETGGNSTGWN